MSDRHIRTISLLIRMSLWGGSVPQSEIDGLGNIEEGEWREIHSIALRSGVAAIIFDAIMEYGISIPRRSKMMFISSVDKIERKYGEKRRTAVQLAGLFRQNGIRMMILKGVGLSLLYPHPNHRPCSDIDIYLFGEQKRGDEIVRKRLSADVNESHHHHTVFYVNGIMVENHYDFVETHSRRSKKTIEAYLKGFADTEPAIAETLDGETIYTPSPNLNAMFLILHSGSHFAAENISLRHLTDWALFLDRYGDSVDWGKMYEIADKCGFTVYLDCLNSMCTDYIGLSPDKCPRRSTDTDLVERAWRDVLKYKEKEMPSGIVKGWIFRIKRRISNIWKGRMVYQRDGVAVSFIRSALVHLIPPKYWK